MSPTRRELVRATRARIVEGAGRLTRERGPNGFSMDVLAKEAGVARATVYEHFRSKRAVLDELASSISRTIVLDEQRTGMADARFAHRDRAHGHRPRERRRRREAAAPSRRGALLCRPAPIALVHRRGRRRARGADVLLHLRATAARTEDTRPGRGRARQARGVDRHAGCGLRRGDVLTSGPTRR